MARITRSLVNDGDAVYIVEEDDNLYMPVMIVVQGKTQW